MSLSRRRLLRLAGGAGVGLGLAGCGFDWTPGQTGQLVRSTIPLPEPFSVPLPIPQPLKAVRSANGADVFEIVQRRAEVEILPNLRTEIWGYDGSLPGPLLESRSGRPTVVRHHNDLDVPVAVHLHGGHVPSDSDGYPTDLVQPGTSREYHYPMKQRAATLWYHDHRMDFTGPQVYRGLFGMHIVRDSEDDGLPLPRGDHEIPLLIADRSFGADGQFVYPSGRAEFPAGSGHGRHEQHTAVDDDHVEGVLGDVILVNGAPWPVLEVDSGLYRLRLLNGCNARRLDLALDPPPRRGAHFTQIGSDGGLLEHARAHHHLQLAQAERFDVLVDFSSYPVGTRVSLRNRIGAGRTGEVMQFHVVRRTGSKPDQLPHRLSTIEPLDHDGVTVREWRFSRGIIDDQPGWVMNGKPFDPAEMRATVPLGEVEVWRFHTDLHHPVHVHLDPFQVIRRGGHEPGPFDHGWKDTVDVRPAEHVDVAVRFTDYAGRYVIHCHNLEHEDRMMMAAFETA